MTAINKKWQPIVTKAVTWLMKHNIANDQRNLIGDSLGDECETYRKIDRECERTFDEFLMYMGCLPKREQERIYQSKLYKEG